MILKRPSKLKGTGPSPLEFLAKERAIALGVRYKNK